MPMEDPSTLAVRRNVPQHRAPMNTPTVIITTLGPDELRALVREELRAALAENAAPSPATSPRVTLDELARLEGCSRATIRRLVAEGAAGVSYLGASPRFDVQAFRAWLAERGRKGTRATPPPRTVIAGVRLLSRQRA